MAARRVIGLLRDVVAEFGVDKTAQISIIDPGGDWAFVQSCRRSADGELADKPSRPSCATNRLPSACPRPSSWWNRAAPSPVPHHYPLYEVGTVKDVVISATAQRRYVSGMAA